MRLTSVNFLGVRSDTLPLAWDNLKDGQTTVYTSCDVFKLYLRYQKYWLYVTLLRNLPIPIKNNPLIPKDTLSTSSILNDKIYPIPLNRI